MGTCGSYHIFLNSYPQVTSFIFCRRLSFPSITLLSTRTCRLSLNSFFDSSLFTHSTHYLFKSLYHSKSTLEFLVNIMIPFHSSSNFYHFLQYSRQLLHFPFLFLYVDLFVVPKFHFDTAKCRQDLRIL